LKQGPDCKPTIDKAIVVAPSSLVKVGNNVSMNFWLIFPATRCAIRNNVFSQNISVHINILRVPHVVEYPMCFSLKEYFCMIMAIQWVWVGNGFGTDSLNLHCLQAFTVIHH
jgi:hypothetical protein